MAPRPSNTLLLAQRLLHDKRLETALDPFDVTSRPTDRQLEALKDINTVQFRYLVAGNQCFPGYAPVKSSPFGHGGGSYYKPISSLRVGDAVAWYNTSSQKEEMCKVLAVHNNGKQKIWRYTWSNGAVVDATPNHLVLTLEGGKVPISSAKYLLRPARSASSSAVPLLIKCMKVSAEEIGEMEVWDITVDNPAHTYLIYQDFIVSNSGKTALAAREVAWLLTDTHPYWKRPADWKEEPWSIIIGVQNLSLGEHEIWKKRLYPFLKKYKWKEIRSGAALKALVRKDTQDTILFVSHCDGSETNRRHIQGHVAHYVWLDEMPASAAILEELQLRCQSNHQKGHAGFFLATFTPKFRNDEVRKIVDGAEFPYAKKYSLSRFDNPIYSSEAFKKSELIRLAGFSQEYRDTVLYGTWSTGNMSVYEWKYLQMTVPEMPEGYSPLWRHIESVDPAMRSKFGYTLWAEDPTTGVWYLVKTKYIEDVVNQFELIEKVKELSAGVNVIDYISDVAPWFSDASVATGGPRYRNVFNKTQRNNELIKKVQACLSLGEIKIVASCAEFIAEIQSYQWADTPNEKIVNRQRFHILDAVKYFCDLRPPRTVFLTQPSYAQQVREVAAKWKQQNAAQEQHLNEAAQAARHQRYSLRRGRRW